MCFRDASFGKLRKGGGGVFANAEQETEIEDRFACAIIAAKNIIDNPEMNCGYYERPQR